MREFFGCDYCVLLTINMLCHVEVMFIQLLNLCFGLFRPSSGFHLRRFMWLCNDGEISSSVVLIITTIKRRGWGVCSVQNILTLRTNLWS